MDQDFLLLLLLALPLLIGLVWVLRKPYIGLTVLVAILPITDVLPHVPFANSLFPILGMGTLGAYLITQLKIRANPSKTRKKIFLVSLSFIIWIFISNPLAAVQPDQHERIWLFTFIQLVALVWLASELMDKPDIHITLFWFYSQISCVSAFYAIYNGGIAETLAESIRGTGLAGGANTAARYFIVALVMTYHLWVTAKRPFLRFILLGEMGLLILGTLFTVSRTGIFLLIAAAGLLTIQRFDKRRQVQGLFFLSLGVSVTWLFADNILKIFSSTIPAIFDGTDTVGLRYKLWQAGWRMWLDHPLQGVGIGRFFEQLPYYASDLLSPRYWGLGAHNMYVQILSETGIIGFGLFVTILGLTFRILLQFGRSEDSFISSIAQTWFIVFVIMLLGGLTKHDHYDKLLWFMIGIGSSMNGMSIKKSTHLRQVFLINSRINFDGK